jgi:hypothetical protein
VIKAIKDMQRKRRYNIPVDLPKEQGDYGMEITRFT